MVTELLCSPSGKEPGVRRRSPGVGTHGPLAYSPGRQPVGRSLLTDEKGALHSLPNSRVAQWVWGRVRAASPTLELPLTVLPQAVHCHCAALAQGLCSAVESRAASALLREVVPPVDCGF